MKQIMTILAALACLCACKKHEHPHWLHDTWSGTYDIILTNNDTGESEAHVAEITLTFSDDRSECVVEKGIQGLMAVTRKTYKIYMNENVFILNEGIYDSRILYSGELTDEGRLTLTWYTGAEVFSAELVAQIRTR